MDTIKNLEEEYDSLMVELELMKNKKVTELKNKFYQKLPFKKGDIIYNVTGIIKIESIFFKIDYNGRGDRLPIHATYKGTKYKWVKDGLITPTKNKDKGELHSYGVLKKIDNSKVV